MSNQVTFIFKALDNFTKVGKRISNSVKNIINRFRSLNKQSDKTRRKTVNMGDEISSSFRRMAAAATAYFSVTKLITEGARFQDSLADLSAITGSTGKDLEFLSEQAFVLAKASAVAQSQVVKAFTDIASAKSELLKDPEAIVKITEQSLLLANAAGIAIPDAVTASVGALNQFNVGAENAARFVNVLAAGSKVGAARVSDIVESMKNAGPVAAQFNVSFEEANALLQVLAKNGVKGAEAGTALRGSLVKLEKIADGQIAPSTIGVVKSLELLEKAQLSNTQIIKEFGEENLRSILILRQNIPLIKKWKDEITGTNIAQEQADERLKTFNAKLRRLSVTIKGVLIKTFLRLEPVLTKQVEDFSNFLENLKPEQIQGFADSIKSLVKTLSLLGKVFSFIFKILEKIGKLIGEVAASISTLDFSQFTKGTKGILKNVGKEFLKQVPAFGILFNALDSASDNVFKETKSETLTNISNGRTDVNVKLIAPEKTVESIKTKMTGKIPGNIGVNMVTG